MNVIVSRKWGHLWEQPALSHRAVGIGKQESKGYYRLPSRILVDMVTLLESGGIDLGVAQNYLYWHHSSLNLSKKIGFFPFNWVPENPTRGPRGIDLKRENINSIKMITNLICCCMDLRFEMFWTNLLYGDILGFWYWFYYHNFFKVVIGPLTPSNFQELPTALPLLDVVEIMLVPFHFWAHLLATKVTALHITTFWQDFVWWKKKSHKVKYLSKGHCFPLLRGFLC